MKLLHEIALSFSGMRGGDPSYFSLEGGCVIAPRHSDIQTSRHPTKRLQESYAGLAVRSRMIGENGVSPAEVFVFSASVLPNGDTDDAKDAQKEDRQRTPRKLRGIVHHC